MLCILFLTKVRHIFSRFRSILFNIYGRLELTCRTTQVLIFNQPLDSSGISIFSTHITVIMASVLSHTYLHIICIFLACLYVGGWARWLVGKCLCASNRQLAISPYRYKEQGEGTVQIPSRQVLQCRVKQSVNAIAVRS